MKNLLGLALFVLTVSCTANESSELESQSRNSIDRCSALVGSCDYYACVETERLNCGPQGYPLGYGKNYCEKLSAIEFAGPQSEMFTGDGNIWKREVRDCLQEEMEDYFRDQPATDCQQLRTFAFDSHPRCYTQKTSFCELDVSSVLAIGFTILPKDLVSIESQKQVRETASICVVEINERLAEGPNWSLKFELLKYRTLWQAVAASPVSLTAWLDRFENSGEEDVSFLE